MYTEKVKVIAVKIFWPVHGCRQPVHIHRHTHCLYTFFGFIFVAVQFRFCNICIECCVFCVRFCSIFNFVLVLCKVYIATSGYCVCFWCCFLLILFLFSFISVYIRVSRNSFPHCGMEHWLLLLLLLTNVNIKQKIHLSRCGAPYMCTTYMVRAWFFCLCDCLIVAAAKVLGK